MIINYISLLSHVIKRYTVELNVLCIERNEKQHTIAMKLRCRGCHIVNLKVNPRKIKV